MEEIVIQEVTKIDLLALQRISVQTFSETFATTNTEENMTSYLNEAYSLVKLTAEINNSDSKFYFSIFENRVIGYLKLNFGKSQTELKDSMALEIERIYVLQEFHGKKVGQILYDKAIQVANQMQKEYVWLGVWEENKRALSFYKKNGFIEFDKHIFILGDDAQTDIMMKLLLQNSDS